MNEKPSQSKSASHGGNVFRLGRLTGFRGFTRAGQLGGGAERACLLWNPALWLQMETDSLADILGESVWGEGGRNFTRLSPLLAGAFGIERGVGMLLSRVVICESDRCLPWDCSLFV